MSLAVLFFLSGFSGTWTWRTCETLFCVLDEGRADRRDTGDMSDLVDRLSLKFLDTIAVGKMRKMQRKKIGCFDAKTYNHLLFYD